MARAHDVYLSSTLRDLADERAAVEDVLTAQGYGVKQSYSADEQSVHESCLADVARCAVYIGVIGLRYGHCPPPGEVSITELEFREAQQLKTPCFVFIKSPSARTYGAADMDSATGENEHGQRIARFRARLESGELLRAQPFTTVQSLREAVLAMLPAIEREVEQARPIVAVAARGRPASELAAWVQRLAGVSSKQLIADLLQGRIDDERLDAVAADEALSRQACGHLLASERSESSAWKRRVLGELLARRPDAGLPLILDHAFADDTSWGQRLALLSALRLAEGGTRVEADKALLDLARTDHVDTLRLVITGLGYLGESLAARGIADKHDFARDDQSTDKLASYLARAGLADFLHREGALNAGMGVFIHATEAFGRLGKRLDNRSSIEEMLHNVRPGLAPMLLRYAQVDALSTFAEALLAALVGRLPAHAAQGVVALAQTRPSLLDAACRAVASIGDESVWEPLNELAGSPSALPSWVRPLAIGWIGDARYADEIRTALAHPGSYATLCALWAAGRLALADEFVAPLRQATRGSASALERATAWLALARTDAPPTDRELMRAFSHASQASEQIVLGIAGALAGHVPVVQVGLIAADRHYEPLWRFGGWGRHLYSDFEAACQTRLGAPGSLMSTMLQRGHY